MFHLKEYGVVWNDIRTPSASIGFQTLISDSRSLFVDKDITLEGMVILRDTNFAGIFQDPQYEIVCFSTEIHVSNNTIIRENDNRCIFENSNIQKSIYTSNSPDGMVRIYIESDIDVTIESFVNGYPLILRGANLVIKDTVENCQLITEPSYINKITTYTGCYLTYSNCYLWIYAHYASFKLSGSVTLMNELNDVFDISRIVQC